MSIKLDLREVGLEGVECIYLVVDGDRLWAFLNTGMNLWVP
jgi:hypothetical protein